MKPEQDAYGREVYDFYLGQPVTEIIEREDGLIGLSASLPAGYFAPYLEWPSWQQEAIGFAHGEPGAASGRCLDIGCGPGRVSLHLQEQGREVVGIDNSPLAIETAKLRGVKDARVLSITQVSRQALGVFGTIIMFGNNFGLFGNVARARWLLRRFAGMTTANGRILAESRAVYQTTDPDHLAYQEWNRQRGRMSGQIRIRVRHKTLIGPWFDYLMVSPAEMADIVAGTGWQVGRIIQQEGEAVYTAVLEKV
ncbi:MAG TPA: methyltransferase domain-containing protein [Chloroflexota bacterium]|nr:methyltransferase domain-containing protein [Chloroflexota bacterium]